MPVLLDGLGWCWKLIILNWYKWNILIVHYRNKRKLITLFEYILSCDDDLFQIMILTIIRISYIKTSIWHFYAWTQKFLCKPKQQNQSKPTFLNGSLVGEHITTHGPRSYYDRTCAMYCYKDSKFFQKELNINIFSTKQSCEIIDNFLLRLIHA